MCLLTFKTKNYFGITVSSLLYYPNIILYNIILFMKLSIFTGNKKRVFRKCINTSLLDTDIGCLIIHGTFHTIGCVQMLLGQVHLYVSFFVHTSILLSIDFGKLIILSWCTLLSFEHPFISVIHCTNFTLV